jgi:RNA-binding protein
LAHKIRPVVFVGEGGISDSVAGALDDALTAHELVKVRLRQPDDKKAAAQSLADATGSALCAVVGHTVVLFRPNPDEPRIVLPERD